MFCSLFQLLVTISIVFIVDHLLRQRLCNLKGRLMRWCKKKKKGELYDVSQLIFYNLDDNDDNK